MYVLRMGGWEDDEMPNRMFQAEDDEMNLLLLWPSVVQMKNVLPASRKEVSNRRLEMLGYVLRHETTTNRRLRWALDAF